MTAFLFIPSHPGARLVHRVDFANIAGLFAEAEEPAAERPSLQSQAIRIAAFAAIVLALIGDTVLIARPAMLTHAFASQVLQGRVVS